LNQGSQSDGRAHNVSHANGDKSNDRLCVRIHLTRFFVLALSRMSLANGFLLLLLWCDTLLMQGVGGHLCTFCPLISIILRVRVFHSTAKANHIHFTVELYP
jgi:hypothetical protein